jgi:hypothetical protein
VVGLDATLGEELLEVAVGQAEAQVPADREHDYIGWEEDPAKVERVGSSGERGEWFSWQESHLSTSSRPMQQSRRT